MRHQPSWPNAWFMKHVAYIPASIFDQSSCPVAAASSLKFWSYAIHDGHWNFLLSLAIVAIYISMDGARLGCFVRTTAAYIEKHWVQTPRSGMTFLVCASSDAFTSTSWPSRPLAKVERGLLSPLAGGRSPNSTYLPAKIDSTMERFSKGTPAAMMIVSEALELSPPLGGKPVDNMGWQAAADGWVSAVEKLLDREGIEQARGGH